MKRLVVNADDFGLTESVNRGIIVAHREGILTSASLLATVLDLGTHLTNFGDLEKTVPTNPS